MILNNLSSFLDKLLEEINKVGIDVSNYELDHIAYQASSNEDYDGLRPEFLKMGELLREDLVSGRRVGILKLNEPLDYKNYEISALELIAPKKGQKIKSSLQHAEFVIDESLRSFVDKHPNVNWNTSAIDREPYSHLVVSFEDIVVKFHPRSILDIVASLDSN